MPTRFKTQYNQDEFPIRGEVNRGVSMTIPDQTMSIKEIMRRYAQGLPVAGEKVPVYDEENDLPDPRKMDLVEIQEAAEDARAEYKDIAVKYKQEMDDKAAAAKKVQEDKYKEYQQKIEELDKKYNQQQKSDVHFTKSNKDQNDPRLNL